MECRLLRLPLSVTAARELDSAHATTPATLISLAQCVTENERNAPAANCAGVKLPSFDIDVEGSVFSHSDNRLLLK